METPLQHRIGITYLIRYASQLGPPAQNIVWSPDDFGQARMAALGWLLGFEEQGKIKSDGLLSAVRARAEKAPADVHALWDWFYVCQMHYDNSALFEAARRLSRAAATDPVSLCAYLYTMGGRHLPQGGEFTLAKRLTGWSRTRSPLRSNAPTRSCDGLLPARCGPAARTWPGAWS